MRELGRGQKVFDARAVRGRLSVLETADDVLRLPDDGADDVVAMVRDAGATFLAPLFGDLTGVICTAGTLRSHIGLVTRDFQVPCAMAVVFIETPVDGALVELDCSGEDAVIRG